MRTAAACATLTLLIVAVVLAVATTNLSRVAGLVPAFILVPTVGLLLFQLGLDLTGVAPGGAEAGQAATRLGFERSDVRALLLPLAFLAGILLMGMTWGPPAVALGYLRLSEKESLPRSLSLAVALLAVLWLVFGRALGVALPSGLLGEALPVGYWVVG